MSLEIIYEWLYSNAVIITAIATTTYALVALYRLYSGRANLKIKIESICHETNPSHISKPCTEFTAHLLFDNIGGKDTFIKKIFIRINDGSAEIEGRRPDLDNSPFRIKAHESVQKFYQFRTDKIINEREIKCKIKILKEKNKETKLEGISRPFMRDSEF